MLQTIKLVLALLGLAAVTIGLMAKLVGQLVAALYALLCRVMNARNPPTQRSATPTPRALAASDAPAASPSEASAKNDTWEGSFWDVGTPHAVHALLRFDYRNGDGELTQRTVSVRRFGGYMDTTLLLGRCHLRNANRSFRADRIQNCVDQETGEIIDDLPGWLHARYASSPDRARDKLLAAEHDLLSVLLYVAKIDGRVMAKERAAILEACNKLSPASQLNDKSLSNMLQTMHVPRLQAFRMALGRLAMRDETTRSLLLTTCENILLSKKAPTAAEQETLAYVQQRLKPERG